MESFAAVNNSMMNISRMESGKENVAPTNNDRNDPTHVGHAINNPVVAPILPNPPVFLVIEIALTANAVFVATRYETIICSSKLIGTTLMPICSVR